MTSPRTRRPCGCGGLWSPLHDQTGGGPVRQELARVFGDQPPFRGRDPAAAMEDLAFTAHAARLESDRAYEVDACFKAGVALTGGEHGLDRAPHGRIKKGHRVA